MKLKIVSDGTMKGTRVENAETGEVLQYVRKVSWSLDCNTQIPVAHLDVVCVSIEATGTGAVCKEILPD